ncbi:MAG TPA: hypothetical protein VE869_11575 [Gemmatimonas sp.]|nr:hypothetical protein [Gemmatimonas sp.]
MKRTPMLGTAALLYALSSPAVMHSQRADASAMTAERFVAEARRATERFKDISVAVTESYLKVGPDFPAMGEHWVNAELIMRAEFNPARPAILTYATIDGKHTLTGAVYALALRPGEKPPAIPTDAQWHDHVGTIDEESLLFGHDRQSGSDDLRLVVMHAWLWTENPGGMFATDNWTLPLARLGITGSRTVPSTAARALSMIADSVAYHERLFTSAGALDEKERVVVEEIIARHRTGISAWWAKRETAPTLQPDDVEWLSRTWAQLRSDVTRAISSAAAKRLDSVFGHH